MELKEIVSVAGVSGLKRIVAQRPDGLIVSDLDGTGRKFMSSRINMFTPLENISIYTLSDTEPLGKVLWKMKQLEPEHPPVSPKADVDELRAYMEKVLPEYDPDQVFVSDIKKLIKWYEVLKDLDVITDPEAAAPEAEEKSDEA